MQFLKLDLGLVPRFFALRFDRPMPISLFNKISRVAVLFLSQQVFAHSTVTIVTPIPTVRLATLAAPVTPIAAAAAATSMPAIAPEEEVTRASTVGPVRYAEVRLKVVKFVLTKLPDGFKIDYETVCEIESKVAVYDKRSDDNDVVTPSDPIKCNSTYKNSPVSINIEMFVRLDHYDPFYSNKPRDFKNYTVRFAVTNKDNAIILQNFNSIASDDINLKNMVFDFSTDSQSGQLALQAYKNKMSFINTAGASRQGFLATAEIIDSLE